MLRDDRIIIDACAYFALCRDVAIIIHWGAKSLEQLAVHCASFGEQEPEEYSIAWADAAARFPTRDLHIQHKPVLADTGVSCRDIPMDQLAVKDCLLPLACRRVVASKKNTLDEQCTHLGQSR